MDDTRISLAHGNGGRFMRELIEEVFARHLANDNLDVQADAVSISLDEGEVVFTTDGFTVQPLEFPGGDIGSLAIHGTTNDLAVAGARPMYMTLNAFIEEGLEMAVLDRIVASLARAAKEAVLRARAKGIKAGLFRPITIFPFASDALRDLAGGVRADQGGHEGAAQPDLAVAAQQRGGRTRGKVVARPPVQNAGDWKLDTLIARMQSFCVTALLDDRAVPQPTGREGHGQGRIAGIGRRCGGLGDGG